MARKVFYSFHYGRDAWRAAQVRNSFALADEDEYGVIDGVAWEKIEREGEEAIKRWINEQLQYTSVTVVLIGAETAERDWVDYEIRRSWERGNGLLGVRIHSVQNEKRETDVAGHSPFDGMTLDDGTRLSSICKVYDWTADNGLENLGKWVEEAFQEREKYGADKKITDDEGGTGQTIARAIPVSSPAGGFTPRSPWSDDTK
jgi:hypothetical protein